MRILILSLLLLGWIGATNAHDYVFPATDLPASNFGIDLDKLNREPEKIVLNGTRDLTKRQAIEEVQKHQLPDEKDKLWLVVVLSKAERKPVLDSVKSVTGKLLVQEYDPSSPMVRLRKFEPGITLMLHDGKQLLHQPSLDATKLLAKITNPGSPSLPDDPLPPINPTPNPNPLPPLDLSKLPPAVYLIVAILLFLLGRNSERLLK